MNQNGLFVAALLDAGSRAYAAGAIGRLQQADPAVRDLVESFGFGKLVGDTEIRLRHLAESLAAGRPELFQLDVGWMREAYVARSLPVPFLKALLRALREELAESLPPGSDGSVAQTIDAGMQVLESEIPGTPPLDVQARHGEAARRFQLAAMEGRRRDAVEIVLDQMEAGASVSDLHRFVIAPVQADLGRMWHLGEIHIAEEHVATGIVEETLAAVRARMPRGPSTGRSVITASVPGNLHDLGPRIVSDHFEMAGWQSFFVGADTPAEDLLRAIADYEVDLVALSVGLSLGVRCTAALVDAIHAGCDVPVIVGGHPFQIVPDLWKDVGADGFASDADGAVREAERLLAG